VGDGILELMDGPGDTRVARLLLTHGLALGGHRRQGQAEEEGHEDHADLAFHGLRSPFQREDLSHPARAIRVPSFGLEEDYRSSRLGVNAAPVTGCYTARRAETPAGDRHEPTRRPAQTERPPPRSA